jgi:hypothetical protein
MYVKFSFNEMKLRKGRRQNEEGSCLILLIKTIMMKILHYCLVIIVVAFMACNKKDDPAYDKSRNAEFTVEFDNVAGSADLSLNTSYQNALGEELTIKSLQYLIHNIILTAADGSTYTLPEGDVGFLVDESEAESTEISAEIPESEYKTLKFDVEYFEMDGTSTVADTAFNYILVNNTGTGTKTITLDLTARGTAKLKTGRHSEVHLLIDVLKFFTGFSIADHPRFTSGDFNALPASNLSIMIQHDHTHND